MARVQQFNDEFIYVETDLENQYMFMVDEGNWIALGTNAATSGVRSWGQVGDPLKQALQLANEMDGEDE